MNKPYAILIPFTLMASACGGSKVEPVETETPRTPVTRVAQENGRAPVVLRGCAEGYQVKLVGNPLHDGEQGLRLICEPKKNSTNSLTP